MATLYPGNIGVCKSDAEKKLYNIFKTFSDDFYIIHSLNWLSSIATEERNRFSPDGEIDFVMIHKTFGILCIEIKGGCISYNRHAFFTNGKALKKSPYAQVKENMYAILDLIQNSLKPIIGYAVGFPDSNVKKYNNNYDNVTFDITYEGNLEQRIIQIYQFWNNTLWKKQIYLSKSQIEKILDILLPTSMDVVNNKINYDNVTWLNLSNEQTNIITEALNNKHYFISGRAGTGKTILAIILAKVLAEEKGKKILFLSFNKEITEKIQHDLEYLNTFVDVLTFHRFLTIYNPIENISDVIKNEHKVLEAIITKVNNLYDCLIIDEAQSLQMMWLNNLNRYFENKKIYVFSDELQAFGYEGKVSNTQMDKIFNFNGQKILTRNYRSPYKVYKRLLEMFTPSIEQTSPRSVDELDLVERISEDNLKQTIENTIDELLNQSVDKNNIVLLISSSAPAGLKNFTYKDISMFTVQKYRGMEKPIVIYVITSTNKNSLNEFYVAYSRATTQTIVIIQRDMLSKGKSYLEQLLLNSEITDNNLKSSIHKEIESFNNLLASNHDILHLFEMKIYYSNKYLLFMEFEYSFINSLLIEYFLSKNIASITINKYDLTSGTLHCDNFKEMNLNNLEFEYCEDCKTTTYNRKQTSFREKFCLNCSKDKFNDINISEIQNLFTILENLHESNNQKIISTFEQSLVILARFYYLNYHRTLTIEMMELLNSQNFDAQNIYGILKLLIALDKHPQEIISIDEIRNCNYIKKLIHNDIKWKQESGININRFLTHGFLEKISQSNKKIYKINRSKIFSE